MTAPFASPLYVPKFRVWNSSGTVPLALGKVYTYVAGSVSTPLPSYPTYADAIAGTNANANPVILDANGEANIFVTNAFYKIRVENAAGVLQWEEDFVASALGYPQPYPTEWVAETNPTVFASGTQFTVTGVDVTVRYHAGRRVQMPCTAGVRYGTVRSSVFGANTTVNVDIDGGLTIDSGLNNVAYGFNSYINPSYLSPQTVLSVVKNGNQVGFAGSTKVITWSVTSDANGEWVAGSNHWLCRYPGRYLITGQFAFSNTAANIQHLFNVCDTAGTVLSGAEMRSSSTAGQVWTANVHVVLSLLVNATISAFITGDANTTLLTGAADGHTRFSILRMSGP